MALSLSAPSLWAQQASSGDGEQADPQTEDSTRIDTSDRPVDGALEGKPQRVERISSKDLARRGVTDLAQALEWLSAGAQVSPTGTTSGLVVDGLPASQLVVLRDGLPITRAAGSPQGPIVDLSTVALDPATVERIDIYRGVGPVGSGATGGVVIDVITRRSRGGYRVFGQGQLNTQTTSPFRQDYTLGGAVGLGLGLDLEVMGQTSSLEALDVNADELPDTPGRERWHGEASLSWRPNSNDYLRLQVLGNTTETTSLGGPDAALDDRVTRDTYRARVKGRWWLGKDLRLDHHSDGGYHVSDFEKLVRSSGFERPKAETTQYNLTQTAALTWFVGGHDLAVEVAGNLRQVERVGETGALPSAQLHDAGVGMADTWYITKGLETFARVYAEGSTQFGFGLNAYLGGAWAFHPNLSWRASVSRTRRQPTAEELFLFFDHSEVGYRVQGNEDLLPETLTSFQSGLAWTALKRRVGIEVQGYVHLLDDVIVTAASDAEAALFTYDNLAQARTAGVQITTQLRRIPGGLQLLGNYTYLPLAEDSTGERLALRSEHAARVELRGMWWHDRIEAWTDVQGRSALSVPPGSPAAPGFALWGVGMGFHLGPFARLIVDVNNIFDQRNATWGPTPGFNALASLRLGYGVTPDASAPQASIR